MFSPVEWWELALWTQLDEWTVASAKKWLCNTSPLKNTIPSQSCPVMWNWFILNSNLLLTWYGRGINNLKKNKTVMVSLISFDCLQLQGWGKTCSIPYFPFGNMSLHNNLTASLAFYCLSINRLIWECGSPWGWHGKPPTASVVSISPCGPYPGSSSNSALNG